MEMFGSSNKVVDFNETLKKIIKHYIPQLNIKLVNKKEGMQKTYSCVYLFGETLYVGTRSSKLYIYKINGSALQDQQFINPHCEVVSSVIADHKFFITIPQCDQESQLCIWETKNKMFLTAFKGHKSQISKAIFMKNQPYIATASWDGTARIWSLANLQNDQHIKLYKGTYPILELAQLNKQMLVFGGDDCYLIFWNWSKEEVVTKVFGHAGSVTCIYPFLPYMLTCGGDNKFKIWELSRQLDERRNQITSLAILVAQQQYQQQSNQPKMIVKLLRQDKNQYDSLVFCLALKQDDIYIIDRQGESFLTNPKQTFKLVNEFQYNQNVTGVAKYGNLLFMTTTKGCIKVFQTSRKKKDVQQDIIEQNLGVGKA